MLKGFTKVKLEPGETETVVFESPAASLAYYDIDASVCVVKAISYKMYVGLSPRTQDLLTAEFHIMRDD